MGLLDSIYSGVSNLTGSVSSLHSRLSGIANSIYSISNRMYGISSSIYSGFNSVRSAIFSIGSGIASIGNSVASVVREIPQLPRKTLMAFDGAISSFSSVGEWISDGFKKVLLDPAIKGVKTAFDGIKQIPEQIQGFLLGEPPHDSKLDPSETQDFWLKRIVALDATVFAIGTGLKVVDAVHPFKSLGIADHFYQTLGLSAAGYLSYAYVSQYLAIAMQEPLRQHYNHELTPARPDFQAIMTGRSRLKISRNDFEEELKYQGIDPRAEFDDPMDFFTEKSLEEHPFNPERWETKPIKDYGELYQELSNTPISYFILNMVAQSGFYDDELFYRALRDSDYGAFATALIRKGLRERFIDRKRTKYEDLFDNDYLEGHITEAEYLDNYRSLGYTEAIGQLNLEFWKGRKFINKKRASVSLLTKRFKEGGINVTQLRAKLLSLKYSHEDTELIIDQAIADITEPLYLTKTETLQAYKNGLIIEDEAFVRLRDMQIHEYDIGILLELHKPK